MATAGAKQAKLSEHPYHIAVVNEQGLPLRIEAQHDRSVDSLCRWMTANDAWLQEQLVKYGALLLRGFDVAGPPDFERVVRCIDGDLKNNYLGTSPRDALTEYVFSASELPGYYPIPQHCEMSFLANPPRRLFFSCLVEPGAGMGETPLVDFRTVWRDMSPAVRDRFVQGGIRIVRNYSGPSGGSRFELSQLKRWDEIFRTTDRAAVEAQCREAGMEWEWLGNDGLRLINDTPVFRDHPQTGERVWHNHTQVFHLSAAAGEYKRIAALRPTWRHRGMRQFARALEMLNRARRSSVDQPMHCTYADGREIPDADMEHVRDVIWKHIVINPWKRGDIVAIDNHSVSHGRLPYEGPRQVCVCWA
jgi:alpha-ketoglutarate-dependent taurine dioxygenase